MKRSLRLRSEPLTQLTSDELGSVAGAGQQLLSLLDCIETRTLDGCLPPPPTFPPRCNSIGC